MVKSKVSDLTCDELQEMLELASVAGAKKALHSLGLHDEDAASDIKELRSLLDSWRATKETAWKTVVDWVVKLFLGALLLGAYVKSGGNVTSFLK